MMVEKVQSGLNVASMHTPDLALAENYWRKVNVFTKRPKK